MRRAILASTIALIIACSGVSARADDDSCSALSAHTQAAIDAITKKYDAMIADQQGQIKKQAQIIEDDAKNDKPDNAVEGVIKFKFKVSSHIETISLDVPEVTVRDKEMSFDLPEVSIKQQTWKYDIPQTKMGMQCIDGPPETVCHMETKNIGFGIKTDIPVCSLRPGKQICTEVPEFYIATTETTLGVPEVAMKTQKIVIGVPEFKMGRQEIKFSVPDLTLVDIEASQKETQKKSDDLTATAKQGSQALAEGMKAEIAKASSDSIAQTMDCERASINAKRNEALATIEKNISVVQAALTQAKAVNAAEFAQSMQATLEKPIASRKETNEAFDKALAQVVMPAANEIPVEPAA
jgi:hypothetical protein